MHAAKTRPRAARGGRERPPWTFGGWKPLKSGSLPPALVFFARAFVTPSSYPFSFVGRTCLSSLGDLRGEFARELPRTFQPSPHLFVSVPKTASWPQTVINLNAQFGLQKPSARRSFGSWFRFQR